MGSQLTRMTIWGGQALWYACLNGASDVVRLLLQRTGDNLALKEKDSTGKTLLHAMAIGLKEWDDAGVARVATLLLDEDIKVDIKDNKGRTAVWYGCPKGNLHVIKLLLERGKGALTVEEKDNMGRSLLHAQVMAMGLQQDMRVVSFLLNRDIEVDVKDNKGRTILWYAGKKRLDKVERFLLEVGADKDLAFTTTDVDEDLSEESEESEVGEVGEESYTTEESDETEETEW